MDDLMLPPLPTMVGVAHIKGDTVRLSDRWLTREEIDDGWIAWGVHTENQLREYAKAAVEAEREACARVCDDIRAKYKWPDDDAERVATEWCAESIRARR